MPNLAEIERCTGCTSCACSCQKGAIEMISNHEGFLYPRVNNSKCVSCGLCERVCPILNPLIVKKDKPKSFLVQNTNACERIESTSGGGFSLISKYVLKNGGIVFGASFDDCFKVRHTKIDNLDDLCLFRNSKYVQSDLGTSYLSVLNHLKANRLVLFSGTPCQINGLKSFLNLKKCSDEKLITVDVICHAVPSPLLLDKYISYQKERHSFNKLVFRDKKYGYLCSCLSLFDNKKRVYSATSIYDPYMRLFLHNIGLRMSCYNCESQPYTHNSDFTLWDCWQPNNLSDKKHDNLGTTNLIAWTEKSQNIVDKIRSSGLFSEVSFNKQYSGERKHVFKLEENRDVFFDDLNNLKADDFFRKYAPITLKIRFKEKIRIILARIHLHDFVRRIIWRFKH